MSHCGWADLPNELLLDIFARLFPSSPHDQRHFNCGNLLLVCQDWYTVALQFVYSRPLISSRNLFPFVRAINDAPLKDNNGQFVQSLDLGLVITGLKNSSSSRLVRRCSARLEEFYAPQCGFAQSSFRAITLCQRLKILDLHAVSEKVEIAFFLQAISKVPTLEVINFPRFSRSSAVSTEQHDRRATDTQVSWPPSLRHLHLCGAITDSFLESASAALLECSNFTSLAISSCPQITQTSFMKFLERLGPRLGNFSAIYPLPLSANALNHVLQLCPNLTRFHGYIDYFTNAFFFPSVPQPDLEFLGETSATALARTSSITKRIHPLEILSLDSAGGLLSRDNKITADDVTFALLDGYLGSLKVVRWTTSVGWRRDKSDVKDLGELLEESGGWVRCVG